MTFLTRIAFFGCIPTIAKTQSTSKFTPMILFFVVPYFAFMAILLFVIKRMYLGDSIVMISCFMEIDLFCGSWVACVQNLVVVLPTHNIHFTFSSHG